VKWRLEEGVFELFIEKKLFLYWTCTLEMGESNPQYPVAVK
jgi:hypothetical protein